MPSQSWKRKPSTGRGASWRSALTLLWLCLWPLGALGHPPAPGDDSIKARLKACLLAGDMACVVDQYLLLQDLGRMPGWLVAFQNAFAVANRKAGECERVARIIHEGLVKLGERPEYIRFSVIGARMRVLGFDETAQGTGKTYQISTTGMHVAIRLGNKVIDAYTGLAGLPFQEYVARLRMGPGGKIVDEVVNEL